MTNHAAAMPPVRTSIAANGASGTMNVVGGFVVTDRMLAMFKRRPEADE